MGDVWIMFKMLYCLFRRFGDVKFGVGKGVNFSKGWSHREGEHIYHLNW